MNARQSRERLKAGAMLASIAHLVSSHELEVLVFKRIDSTSAWQMAQHSAKKLSTVLSLISRQWHVWQPEDRVGKPNHGQGCVDSDWIRLTE